VLRVGVFGDSMTEAVQVNLEETFCYVIEERFRSAGVPVEIFNFAVNGYSPVQELLVFREEGPRFSIDVAVLALFLDNDVSGSHPALSVSQGGAPFPVAANGALYVDYRASEASFEDYQRVPIYFLRRYSAAYRLISAWRWRHAAVGSTKGLRNDEVPRRYVLYTTTDLPEVWQVAWRNMEQVIMEFVREANRQGVAVILLSVPASQVVSPRAWKGIVRSIPAMQRSKWDLEGPERRLATFASEHGIPLVRPLMAFRQADSGSPLFFGDLGHMTLHGHAVMSRVLEEALRPLLDDLGRR
jgi:hypothetical protein